MKQFMIGAVLGALVMSVGVEAGQFYTPSGKPAAPNGSVQQFDYFRQRQQQLDVRHMREQMDRQRQHDLVNPCGR